VLHSRTLEIAILNWNTWPLVDRALCGLEALGARPDVRVTVVDNASVELGRSIEKKYPWANVIRLDANWGYAGGNNWILTRTSAEFVLLQNSDAFPTPTTIDMLLNCMLQRPRAAAIGPALVDEAQRPQIGAYGNRPGLLRWIAEFSGLAALPPLGALGIWGRSVVQVGCLVPRPVGWVSGACLMLRMEAVRDVGLLDDGYFMYMEDLDWCERARQRGWQILYLPGASVTHLFGSSQGRASTRWIDSMLGFLQRAYPSWMVRILAGVGALGYGWRAVVYGMRWLPYRVGAQARRSNARALALYALSFAKAALRRRTPGAVS